MIKLIKKLVARYQRKQLAMHNQMQINLILKGLDERGF